MDEERPQQSPVAPNLVALIAIAALASSIALIPYFLFSDLLVGLPAVALASAVLAWLALRKLTTEAPTEPSLGEWVLGAWSAVATPSLGGLFGLTLFGLFYGGVELFIWAAHYFGFSPHSDPWVWGFWGSIWLIVVVIAVGAIESFENVFRQLYPREAGARSAFFPLLARWKLLALVASAALIALGLMLWLLDLHGIAFPVLLSILLFYSSLPLKLAGSGRSDTAQIKIVDALAALLQEGGYRIVRTPRTGKAEIDPLLRSVDLLARTGDRAFAVQVKSIASSAPVEWNEATALRTAAQLLSDEIVTGSAARVPVEPLLMLVGGTVAQSLAAFSQRERIPVVHFKDTSEATDNRQEFIRRLQAAGLVFAFPQAASSASA
jgi:hypothetical protein